MKRIDKAMHGMNMRYRKEKGIYEYGNSKRNIWIGKSKCRGDDALSEWT